MYLAVAEAVVRRGSKLVVVVVVVFISRCIVVY